MWNKLQEPSRHMMELHTHIYIYIIHIIHCAYILYVYSIHLFTLLYLYLHIIPTDRHMYIHFSHRSSILLRFQGKKNHNCERQTRTQFKKCMFMQLKVVDGKKQHEREHLRANDWSTASIPNIYKMETRRNLRQRNSSPLSLDSTSWSLNFIPKAISNIQDYKDIDCSTMEQMVLDYILNLKRLKY